ncbi:MAG: protein BatD [Ketobacter sp.]|nr:protein BatD [Ketobacter sp.]
MVKRTTIFTFLVLTLFSLQAHALNISAKLNTEQVMQGDTVKLIVTIDERADGKTPDFTVLNQHFDVLTTYTEERSNIINGRFTSLTSWILTLLPKQTGYIAVPPISFNGATSKPVKLHVTKRTAAKNADQLLFVEAKVDKDTVYVQEQVIYTVRIFRHDVDIYDPSYQPPTIEHAAMELLGEQRNYKTTLNGKEYDVFEFRYALFPQKSGSLSIPPAQLTATVFRGRSRGLTFDPFNGKQVRRSSPTLELEIKPKPDSYPADKPWLPAKSLQLTEAWSPDSATANIGEPLTRTVTMQAEGVLATILPAVPDTSIQGVKIYPEQADTNSKATDDGIVSSRTESLALIATQTGDITLPPMDITWWDVEENAVKVTSLPARVIRVTGTTSRPQTDNTVNAQADTSQAGDTPPPAFSQGESVNRTWQWIAIAFLLLWVITLGLLVWIWQSRNPQIKPKEASGESPFSNSLLKHAQKELQTACNNNSPKAARTALIALFQQHYKNPNIKNLDDIARIAQSEPLSSAFRNLDAELYKEDKDKTWRPEFLLQATAEVLSKPTTNKSNPVLEPLYPA